MDKYICKMCGHVYDPAIGEAKPFRVILCDSYRMPSLQCDPAKETGPYVPAGTDFSALPEGWVCPVCGYPKSYYQKIMPEPLHALRTVS